MQGKMGEFADRVYEIVREIPRGNVATYGLVAKLMGRPQSARYVGFALRNNPAPGQGKDDVPCHRVVFRDGSLCEGFAFGGPDVQRRLLESEGVAFVDDDHVDLDVCLWKNAGRFSTDLVADGPTAPPEDFDWAVELGECE